MDRLLTPAELEIMNVLWDAGEGTVHEVMAALPGDRAYTTLSTLVRILEQKRFVKSRKDGRRHVYAPRVQRETYEKRSVSDMLGRLFRGDAEALVRRLVEPLDAREREAIRRMLEES